MMTSALYVGLSVVALCCLSAMTSSESCLERNTTVCENFTDVWVHKTIKFISKFLKNNASYNVSMSVCVRNTTDNGRGVVNFTLIYNYLNGSNETGSSCFFIHDENCLLTATTTKSSTSEYTTAEQATETTTKPATDSKLVNGLEERSRSANKSRKEKNLKLEVFFPITKIIGSEEEPLFRSDNTNMNVKKMETDVVPRRVVVFAETVVPDKLAKPAVEELNESTQTAAKNVRLIFVNEFVGITAYDSSGDELPIKDLDLTFDLSAGDQDSFGKNVLRAVHSSESSSRTIVKMPQPLCSFFDTKENKWSSRGCQEKSWIRGKSIDCNCNHTTVFAIMMSATTVTVPMGVKIVSYVAELISIIFLLATAVLLIKVRNRVRGDRIKVQICLTSSLLMLHVLSVLHDAALGNNAACEFWAVMTHYSLLCSAMWMLMEGLTLVFKTMDSVMRVLSGRNARKFAIFRYVASFTVPAIIVTISAAVGFSDEELNYMPQSGVYTPPATSGKYQHCWVGEDILVGAVIIPVAVILCCTLLFVVRMFCVVHRMSSESEKFRPADQRRGTNSAEVDDYEHIKAALKATMVLLPVLGITWMLGFFTGLENGGARVAFMYLNVIVNGLQGVMLFFVYCILGKEVRKAIVNSFVRKGYRFSSMFEFSSSSKHRTTSTDISASTANASVFSPEEANRKTDDTNEKESSTSATKL